MDKPPLVVDEKLIEQARDGKLALPEYMVLGLRFMRTELDSTRALVHAARLQQKHLMKILNYERLKQLEILLLLAAALYTAFKLGGAT